MRKNDKATTLRGVVLALALTPILLVLSATPATALPSAQLVSGQAVDGDIVTIRVDGSNGYDGADRLNFIRCGNASAAGEPLATATSADCQTQIFAPRVLNPVDGVDYERSLPWTNDQIGANQTRCIADGLIECSVVVVVAGGAGPTQRITVDVPSPGPTTPALRAGSVIINEEGTFGPNPPLQLPIELSERTTLEVTVDWELVDGTATAPDDYVAASGTLTIPPLARSGLVPIIVNDDLLAEGSETLYVIFSNPTNATIAGYDGLGLAAIFDFDEFQFTSFPSEQDRMLDPGSVLTLPYAGLTENEAIVVSSCGNADAAGNPLDPNDARNDPDRCHTFADVAPPRLDGQGRQTMVVPGAPANRDGSGTIRYEWTEPIGADGTTCITPDPDQGASLRCEIRVIVIDVRTFAISHAQSFDIAPRTPTLQVVGPTDNAYNGSTFSFTATGLASVPGQRLAICGNADGDGIPLAIADQGVATCQTPNGSLRWWRYNVIFGGVDASGDPFATYRGEVTWTEPIINDDGDLVRCVADGEFPCRIILTNGLGPDAVVDVTPGPVPIIQPESIETSETADGSSDLTTVQVPVTLSAAVPGVVSVDWETVALTADSEDFVSESGTLLFTPGATTSSISLRIIDDALDEDDELFAVRFFNANGAEIGGYFGLSFIDIIDDDEAPSVIPEFIEVREGGVLPRGRTNDAEVNFRLSAPSARTVMVDVGYEFSASSAILGTDIFGDPAAPNITLTFEPGETVQTVILQIAGDVEVEGDEIAVLRTSNWVNSRPGGYYGLGGVTILDDDAEDCSDLSPGASLRGCDFSGQTFSTTDLTGADLSFADFSDARLIDVDLSDATLRGTKFSGAIVAATDFDGALAGEVDFTDATVASSDFSATDLRGANFDRATVVAGTMINADLSGSTIRDARFLVNNQIGTNLRGVDWGTNTLCADNTVSGAHGDTCWAVPVDLRAGGSELNDNPVSLTNNRFFASFNPVLGFDPAELTDTARFGGPINGVDAELSFTFDSNNDGEIDTTYGFPVAGAPLAPGVDTYCASAVLGSGDHVYGCDELEVLAGPISPPASPPSSPPASGPASGMSVLAELVPFLTGPAGLMVTASGVGLLFMAGSNRAASAMVTDRRKDDEDDEHDGDGDATTDETI